VKGTACFEETENHLFWELPLRRENKASVLLGEEKASGSLQRRDISSVIL